MEKCVEIKDALELIDDEKLNDLRKKLKILHHFNIVHMDIKPTNIMYCKSRDSMVFIDYGFSKVIEE